MLGQHKVHGGQSWKKSLAAGFDNHYLQYQAYETRTSETLLCHAMNE